jgi:glycosyltransferase involved in cell wall biosynthesis
MNPIRVARIITRLNVGGPAYQAILLNHRLPSLGYDSMLIYGSVSNGEETFDRLLNKYPGNTVFLPSLRRNIGPADTIALIQLIKILKKFKPDLVHTHTAKAGMLGRVAGKLVGTKAMVHTYHGHVLEGYFNPLMEKMILHSEQTLARGTDKLITVSDRLKTDLSQRFRIAPAEKFQTIELGLPLERFLHLPERGTFRKLCNIDENAIVLGTLGRLVPIKNHHRMLNVFAGLISNFPDHNIHLLIGGTGPLQDDLKKSAIKMQIANRVHFLGLVEDLPAFYADIDLAILTSDNEGTPVTLIEAMAAGKFVVAPDVGGIGDVIDQSTGILVWPNTVEAYIKALATILQQTKRSISDELRMGIINRFSPDRLLKDIDTLYKQLLHT